MISQNQQKKPWQKELDIDVAIQIVNVLHADLIVIPKNLLVEERHVI